MRLNTCGDKIKYKVYDSVLAWRNARVRLNNDDAYANDWTVIFRFLFIQKSKRFEALRC